ncbi:MAG: alpha/beta hydrolase [Alphaproteobacteria bacterium]|nr:alpha/beta hydrolase [Alphaproteobacteria bacterium]
MSDPTAGTVSVNGQSCRIWSKGTGRRVGVLPGIGGLPQWSPFLDELSQSCTVVTLSPPGFQGSGVGHEQLDSDLDWALALYDLMVGAGLEDCDLIGVSVGGAFAALLAATWPRLVRRLVLVAPLGLFDEEDPSADIFAVRPGTMPDLLCANGSAYRALHDVPEGATDDQTIEWQIKELRALEAMHRYMWPLGDANLAKRLPRISVPTLLVRGDQDAVLPESYVGRFAQTIAGPVESTTIAGAGHLADIDAPENLATRIREFLEAG